MKLRSCLEELAVNCIKYVHVSRNAIITGHGSGKTKLDKERIKMCVRELEALGNMAHNLRALVTKSSLRERYKTGQNYLQKLKFLIEDVSDDSSSAIRSQKSVKIYHLISPFTHPIIYSAPARHSGYLHLVDCEWEANSVSSTRRSWYNVLRGGGRGGNLLRKSSNDFPQG